MAKANKADTPNVEGIQVLSVIGKGNFSCVYKGVDLKDMKNVAIKAIEKKDLTKGKADVIVSEIGIMKSLDHPNIVRMLDFKWNKEAVFIILEYCEGGNLNQYIKLQNRLRERVCKRALQQVASGLAYLRSKNICHMDLKPQNILIKFDPFTLKIADFGLAQYVPEKNYMDNLRGSPLYMAPEILLKKKYNYKVDLWSVGIILFECLFGRAPLAHKNCQELLEIIRNKTRIKYPSTIKISNECKDLLNRLLVYEPDERISYEDFFNHPFIDLAHAPTEDNKNLAYRCAQEAVQYDQKKEYDNAFNSYCRALRYLVPILDTLAASEERAYLQLKISEYLGRAEELKVRLYKEDNYKDKIKKHYSPEERIADYEMSKVLMKKWDNKGENDITSLISSEEIVVRCDSPVTSLSYISSGASFVSSVGSSQIEYVSSSSSSVSEQTVEASGSSTDETEALFSQCSSPDLKDLFGSIPKAKDALEIGQIGQMYMVQGDYKLALTKFESALGVLIPLLKSLQSSFKRDLLMHQIRKWLTLAESAKTLASAKAIHCGEPVRSGVEVNGNCCIQ